MKFLLAIQFSYQYHTEQIHILQQQIISRTWHCFQRSFLTVNAMACRIICFLALLFINSIESRRTYAYVISAHAARWSVSTPTIKWNWNFPINFYGVDGTLMINEVSNTTLLHLAHCIPKQSGEQSHNMAFLLDDDM